MTVNWTPFLTLFPLRFPAAKDIFAVFALLVVVRREEERVVGVSLSLSTTFQAKAGKRVDRRLSNSVVTHPNFPHFSHNRVFCDCLL